MNYLKTWSGDVVLQQLKGYRFKMGAIQETTEWFPKGAE
jgi:hypothetical protein